MPSSPNAATRHGKRKATSDVAMLDLAMHAVVIDMASVGMYAVQGLLVLALAVVVALMCSNGWMRRTPFGCRKQCVHTYKVYDFLKNVARKVPDLGAPDANADHKLGKRRKHVEDESEEESKRKRNEAASQTSNGKAWEGTWERPLWRACS